jgi:hypothetical protein
MELNFGDELSQSGVIVFRTVVVILLICGIPSNTLFLWTLLKIKRLRVIHNAFVGNLAVSDFIITTYLLPFNLVFLFNKDAKIPDVLCRINGSIAHVVFSSSVISVTTIAIHRYFKICHYKLCQRIYTKTTVCAIIAAVWSIGILFAVPLFWMENSLIFDPTFQMCIFNRYVSQTYSIFYLFACLFAPISITMVCYCKIYTYVVRHKRRLLAWNRGIGQARFRNDVRSTKSTFVVFVVYLALYSLFGVVATLFNKHSQVPTEIHSTSIYMAFANSCVNAFIYGFMNKDVLKAYKEALQCRRSRRIQNMNVLTQDVPSTQLSIFQTKSSKELETKV